MDETTPVTLYLGDPLVTVSGGYRVLTGEVTVKKRALGIDVQTENVRRARKMLFTPEDMEFERHVTATFEARGGP